MLESESPRDIINALLSQNLNTEDQAKIHNQIEYLNEQQKNVLENQRILLTEKSDVLKMRKQWSTWILRSIVTLSSINFIFCLSAVYISHCNNSLNQYSDAVLVALFTSGTAEMFGLAFVVAKFLFPETNKN
jgi:hypothetical protein